MWILNFLLLGGNAKNYTTVLQCNFACDLDCSDFISEMSPIHFAIIKNSIFNQSINSISLHFHKITLRATCLDAYGGDRRVKEGRKHILTVDATFSFYTIKNKEWSWGHFLVRISYTCFGKNNVEHDRAKQLVSEQWCTSNETPLLNQYEFKFAELGVEKKNLIGPLHAIDKGFGQLPFTFCLPSTNPFGGLFTYANQTHSKRSNLCASLAKTILRWWLNGEKKEEK